jgi:hypothetical protein
MLITICGDYMTGKTVSACTFPKPMKYLDYDGKFLSATTAKNTDGTLVNPDWKEIEVVPMYESGGQQDLDFKFSLDAKTAPAFAKDSLKINDKFNAQTKEIFGNPGKYKTVVLDSLSRMFRVWKNLLMITNSIPNPRPGDYIFFDGLLDKWFTMMKEMPVDFVILVAHEAIDKDELTGEIKEFPLGISANLGKAMGRYTNELYRQMVEQDKHLWYTKRKGRFNAGSSLSLPSPIPATYHELKKYLPVKEVK